MKNASFSYSTNATVFKKIYGDIYLTVILELPKKSLKKNGRKDAVNVLKDDIYNLLNDSELEEMLTSQKSKYAVKGGNKMGNNF